MADISRIVFLVFIALAAPILTPGTYAQTNANTQPRVFLLDAKTLMDARTRLIAKDKTLEPAIAALEADGRSALQAGIYSVVRKSVTPPSGDRHDYVSQAPYFWPDPKAKNGLPYIRRDGERNPEIEKITDHKNLDDMISDVETLALAYYFRGDEQYAKRAAALLRGFFLDPAMRMNPNLNFGQGIPGVTTGRGIGLIETRGLTRVVDSIGLLQGSKALTDADKRGLQDWFGKFLEWMLESKNGREEAAAKNNHGTYYDVQVASFALFTGKTDLAKKVLEEAKQKRITLQIAADGSQPLELERTKGWSYSVMNLEGLIALAEMGDKAGVDLWNYQTADGRGIRRAIDFLYPFAAGEKWKYQQIGEWPPQILFPAMRRAAGKYTDAKFNSMLAKAPPIEASDRRKLTGQ